MEAKDTVIKLNRGGILSDIEVEYYNRGAGAQAEISFKAGYKQGRVVKWLLSEGGFPWSMDEYPKRIGIWQAQLKEWGL